MFSTLHVSSSTSRSSWQCNLRLPSDTEYAESIIVTQFLHLQSVGPCNFAMSKMIQETAWLAVTVACRMLTSPITKRAPISAFAKLTIPSSIQSPRIQEGVSCCALNILPEVIKAVRGMTNRIRRLFPSSKFVKCLADNFLHSR